MLALSSLVWLIVPLILPCRVRTTWFYLCHHISLSGGKSLLMTLRLLALCFGIPVNAGRANGIFQHKPSLSVYNNFCILQLSNKDIKRQHSKSVFLHTVTLSSNSPEKDSLRVSNNVRWHVVVFFTELTSSLLLSGFKTSCHILLRKASSTSLSPVSCGVALHSSFTRQKNNGFAHFPD